MTRRLLITVLTLGCVLTGARFGRAQVGGSLGADLAILGANLGALGMGMGGGEAMPGAILVKIRGEVLCTDCTLEEMGAEAAPGDLYQFSQENTHMVIKVTKAVPDIAWAMVEGHKLFLQPGEHPVQLQRLLSESKAGKRVEVIAGVVPEAGNFIPLIVKVK